MVVEAGSGLVEASGLGRVEEIVIPVEDGEGGGAVLTSGTPGVVDGGGTRLVEGPLSESVVETLMPEDGAGGEAVLISGIPGVVDGAGIRLVET